jgi:NAD-dependent deacetylase
VDNVIHMHGELASLLCRFCGFRWRSLEDTSVTSTCPACKSQGGPRPDIVWFGEMPYDMDKIEAALEQCDLFVSIGTSGAVYPAAGYVQMARSLAKQTLELNLEKSEGSHFFHESRQGKAGTLVPEWVDEILA